LERELVKWPMEPTEGTGVLLLGRKSEYFSKWRRPSGVASLLVEVSGVAIRARRYRFA
jgi:hypothetical protein